MAEDGSLSQAISARLADVDHQPVSYAPGEIIFAEGSAGDEVVLISEGIAEVFAGGVDHLLARLGPGDIIGEVAALAGGNRTATVRTNTPLSGYLLERPAFEDLLDLVPELSDRVVSRAAARLERRHLLAFFERLFGHLESDVIEEFEQSVEWISLEPGAVLFERGDTADAGYFVIRGRLQEIGIDDDGDEAPLRAITRDELVGESGLFRPGQRTTTVVATRESRLVRIGIDRFLELANRHPLVLVPVVADLATRTRRSRTSTSQRTIGLLVAGDMDSRMFSSRLADGLGSLGSTSHLWAARMDALLGRERVAQSGVHDPAAARLAELLHEQELQFTYLLCEADRNAGEWTRRVARQADVAVAVIDSPIDETAIDMVDAFFQAAGKRSTKVVVVAHPADTKTPTGVRALTSRWSPDHVYNIRAHSREDIGRLARLLGGRASSLVLGGGGARGFAHLGVYRAMTELGIPVDLVGGTSIGSPLGAAMALDLPPAELIDVAAEGFAGVLDYTIPVVSLVKGERITDGIRRVFGSLDIEDLWLPFFCVSTNLTRAQETIHRTGEAAKAIRASLAIPGVIPPVAYGDDLHVDGGVLNNLPGDVMRRLNPAGTVIAVDVAPPVGPRAKGDPGLSVSGWQALRSKTGRQKTSYPGITAVLLRSMITASVRSRARSIDRGDVDLYLDLDLRGISLLDFDNVRPVAQAGYEAAMPRLEAWLEQQRSA